MYRPGHVPTVLLVDDEPATRQLVALLLQHQGYRVLTAADGHEGLHTASLQIPDVILLDLMMPEMDGYEVMRQLRRDVATRDILIIVLTAKGGEQDVAESLRLGAVSHLEKPYEVEELLRRIQLALSMRHGEPLEVVR
jgi:two-component system alkaline phosphatase synthesis response regulator PhoP